ncbi:MAG: N-acetyltransferase, partial [Sphingomonadales bacterium]
MTTPLQTLPPLTIQTVGTDRDRAVFMDVPRRVFAGDPAWAPPFLFELRERLDPARNPYFAHAEMAKWLAFRGDEPVGRISAQINREAIRQHGFDHGNFGFFDVADDGEAAAALLKVAEDWLGARSMPHVIGPYNPTINEEPGILVDGFDTAPRMLMAHSRPYYQGFVEAAGYTGVKDLYAYDLDIRNEILPPSLKRLTGRFQKDGGLVVRPVRMSHYREDLDIILRIFNDAWSGNWGYVPMTDAELRHMADGLKILVRPALSMIAEWEGEPIGMMVTLPNLNEILQKIDGRLLPFGWARLLWWLKVSVPETVRVALMGVLQDHQNSALGAAASVSLIEVIRQNGRAMGVKYADLSWIVVVNL